MLKQKTQNQKEVKEEGGFIEQRKKNGRAKHLEQTWQARTVQTQNKYETLEGTGEEVAAVPDKEKDQQTTNGEKVDKQSTKQWVEDNFQDLQKRKAPGTAEKDKTVADGKKVDSTDKVESQALNSSNQAEKKRRE